MRYVVTGGTGLIGAYAISELAVSPYGRWVLGMVQDGQRASAALPDAEAEAVRAWRWHQQLSLWQGQVEETFSLSERQT
jgi:uncharacterized protein YbjT (DUF2867 family)